MNPWELLENYEEKICIIKVVGWKEKNNSKIPKISFFLSVKNEENILYYDNILVYCDSQYTFDSDQNLQILNDQEQIINIIPAEKYLYLEEALNIKEKMGASEECFIKLPLNRAFTKQKIIEKFSGINFVSIEAELIPESLPQLEEANALAIKYDAQKTFIQWQKELNAKKMDDKNWKQVNEKNTKVMIKRKQNQELKRELEKQLTELKKAEEKQVSEIQKKYQSIKQKINEEKNQKIKALEDKAKSDQTATKTKLKANQEKREKLKQAQKQAEQARKSKEQAEKAKQEREKKEQEEREQRAKAAKEQEEKNSKKIAQFMS